MRFNSTFTIKFFLVIVGLIGPMVVFLVGLFLYKIGGTFYEVASMDENIRIVQERANATPSKVLYSRSCTPALSLSVILDDYPVIPIALGDSAPHLRARTTFLVKRNDTVIFGRPDLNGQYEASSVFAITDKVKFGVVFKKNDLLNNTLAQEENIFNTNNLESLWGITIAAENISKDDVSALGMCASEDKQKIDQVMNQAYRGDFSVDTERSKDKLSISWVYAIQDPERERPLVFTCSDKSILNSYAGSEMFLRKIITDETRGYTKSTSYYYIDPFGNIKGPVPSQVDTPAIGVENLNNCNLPDGTSFIQYAHSLRGRVFGI